MELLFIIFHGLKTLKLTYLFVVLFPPVKCCYAVVKNSGSNICIMKQIFSQNRLSEWWLTLLQGYMSFIIDAKNLPSQIFLKFMKMLFLPTPRGNQFHVYFSISYLKDIKQTLPLSSFLLTTNAFVYFYCMCDYRFLITLLSLHLSTVLIIYDSFSFFSFYKV